MTKRLLLILTLTFLSLSLRGQSAISNFGRDFYLGYAATGLNCSSITPFQSYWMIVSAPYDCNVTVSYFDHTTGQESSENTYKIFAKNAATIPLSASSMIVHESITGKNANADGEIAEWTSVHVRSDRPITISYYASGPDNNLMYLALPTSALGKQYVVAAAPNDDGTGASQDIQCRPVEPSSSDFAVIATADNTHVKITPSGTTRKGNTGVSSGRNANGTQNPFNITLQRGQVYWVKSDIKSAPAKGTIDMTGSQVESDKPVAVLAGCENSLTGMSADSLDDQRNVTCQMMIPVQYWATKDYLTVPFQDAPGIGSASNFSGDQIKVITQDDPAFNCQVTADNTGSRTVAVTPYQFPPAKFENVTDPLNLSSQCDQKIFVEQYDYRAKGSTTQITAPAQMNIVPLSQYTPKHMWVVPGNLSSKVTGRYINVIARNEQFGKIKLWKDGNPIGFLSSLSLITSYSIPGKPQYTANRYSVTTGTYYAVGDSAFIVYQNGTGSFTAHPTSMPYTGYDYFFEYASPAGQTFHIEGGGKPSVSMTTECQGMPYVTIHASDTAQTDNGIAWIEILKDNLGIVKRRPTGDTGYTSYNVQFEPADYSTAPGSTAADAKIVVSNLYKDAEAWIMVVNGAGNDSLVHFQYIAPTMQFGAGTSKGVDRNGDASLDFRKGNFHADTCSQFVFKNASRTGADTYHLMNIRFKLGGQGFSYSVVDAGGNTLSLPQPLAPGDSVIIRVCYHALQLGKEFADTLIAETECPSAWGTMVGSVLLPEIVANDYDFGKVMIGDSVCHTIRVSNTGKAPFTLSKDQIITNYGGADFSFSDTGLLPLTLQPGKSVDFNFCFVPSDTIYDSSVVNWMTDIPEPYNSVKKNYSYLKGKGIKPSLRWSSDYVLAQSPCDSSVTRRVWLFNNGTAYIIIDSIRIPQPSSGLWKVLDAQGGQLKNIILGQEVTPDSMWIDLSFSPDGSQNCKAIDSLIAYDESQIRPVTILLGNLTNGVAMLQKNLQLSITPNPATDIIHITLAGGDGEKYTIQLLDILGTTLMTRITSQQDCSLDLHSLSAGTYFARIQMGEQIFSRRIIKQD